MSFSESRTSELLQGSAAQPIAQEAMQDRAIYSSKLGDYVLAQWDGTNRSRIQPVCDKVLVLVDQASDRSSGGVIIPETVGEQRGMAATTGVLVAVGPQAFAYDSNRLVHWAGERPQCGNRVFFTKYAGNEYTGHDGLVYRLMEDRSIGGVEIPEPPMAEETNDVGRAIR